MSDLLEEVEKSPGGNLKQYQKNAENYNKDPYIFDLISNGLKLDLKEFSSQNRNQKIEKLKKKTVILKSHS